MTLTLLAEATSWTAGSFRSRARRASVELGVDLERDHVEEQEVEAEAAERLDVEGHFCCPYPFREPRESKF